jgi:ABC-type transporter MlaC component
VASVGSIAPGKAAETNDPGAFIAAFAERAAAIARDHPEVDDEALPEWRALLHDGLDLPAIARFVVGPTAWQRASEAQRVTLIDLIEARLAAFYAGRVEADRKAVLTVTGSETLGEDDWLVTSRLDRPDGSAETIEWRLHRSADGQIRVRDIIADGDSLAAARRTEYGQILQRNEGDPAALIETLRERGLEEGG